MLPQRRNVARPPPSLRRPGRHLPPAGGPGAPRPGRSCGGGAVGAGAVEAPPPLGRRAGLGRARRASWRRGSCCCCGGATAARALPSTCTAASCPPCTTRRACPGTAGLGGDAGRGRAPQGRSPGVSAGRRGHGREGEGKGTKGRRLALAGSGVLCSLPETPWRRMVLFFKAQIQPSSHCRKLRLESNSCTCNGVTL